MGDFRDKIVVGNVVMFPAVILQFLAKSHYFLIYDPKTETVTLNANHGYGGQVLFEIRSTSYETAATLALKLGLKGDSETPLLWSKWNPILRLYHDGSKDAELLRFEMLKFGIPHTVHKQTRTFALANGNGVYEPPQWTTEQMLDVVRETAERYKEQLETKP